MTRNLKKKTFEFWYEGNKISHDLSCPIIPQQNEVLENKSKSIQNIDKTMINDKHLAKNLWA